MKRRTFLKAIFPSIFIPKLIIPVWKIVKPVTIYEPFSKFTFPQIRQVFPLLLTDDFVKIQPMMNMPDAKVFYMDFVTTSKSTEDNMCT